jgi:hypothetical protein
LTLPKPAETACGSPKTLGEPNLQWIDEVRKRYAARGVKVLVMASPIPSCDTQIPIYREALQSHLDGELSTLPISMFNDSDRHFTHDGSQVVSELVAKKIRAAETDR